MSASTQTFLPAFAKGKVKRPEVPSASKKIQDKYHEAMEQGRYMEKAIGDAIYEIKKFKKDLEEKVKACLRDIITNINGQLPTMPRAIMYIKNVIDFIKEMKEFLDEIIGVIQALIAMINLLTMILRQIQQMIQSIVNALANLLAELCNWNLPDLPALPNLLGLLNWKFPGFNLNGALGGFKAGLKFDIKFTMPKCSIKLPNFDIFRNYRQGGSSMQLGPYTLNNKIVSTKTGTVTVGSNSTTLPVNTTLGGPIITPEQAQDPEFKKKYLDPKSKTPFYLDTFNPKTDITASVPNPQAIQNSYFMSPKVYQANLASLIPELAASVLPYGTGISSFPDGVTNVSSSGPSEGPDAAGTGGGGTGEVGVLTTSQIESFKILLKDHVNLERVYDGQNPHVASAWIKYLTQSRNSRKGKWIPEYEASFEQYIKPSSSFLDMNDVPYNQIESAPSLPILETIKTLSDTELWKLSFIEASLLSYTRTRRWDTAADTSWFGYTEGALDYIQSPLGDRTVEQVLDSGGLADYPMTVMVAPQWIKQFQVAVQYAANDILNAPDWRTSRPQFRYIYDQYGMATEVDRFSQFWREWSYNFEDMMSNEDPVALPYILEYWQTINSRVNPLLPSKDLYDYLKYDSINRKATWTPGSDIINIPTSLDQGVDIGYEPDDLSTGWAGDAFDPETFLNRPDVKVLPITQQHAMLDINLAYASILATSAEQQTAINNQIESLKALASTSLVKGFKVNSTSEVVIKPKSKSLLSFNETEFDIMNNVVNPTTFVIQDDGQYMFNGEFVFSASASPFTRFVELWVNGQNLTIDQSENIKDSVKVTLSHQLSLKRGDKIQFKAYGSLNQIENSTLQSGYNISAISTSQAISTAMTGTSANKIIQSGGNALFDLTNAIPGTVPDDVTNAGISGQFVWGSSSAGQKTAPAATTLGSLMAVYTNSDGKILPIHPELDSTTVPFFDGVTLNGGNPNDSIVVAMAYGMEYQITTSVKYS